jgi:hypothetical protein
MPVRRPKSPTTLAADATGNIVQIRYGSELFQLREPIDLEARSERGHSVLAYPALDIEGYGADELEALESFADQFGSTWHSIALATDAELTRDAREIKKRMLKLVDRVE